MTTVLEGPYSLEKEVINQVVTKKLPGVYILCHEVESISLPTYSLNVVKVHYVGRSDNDLRTSLEGKAGLYPMFKFIYTEKPEKAFQLECKLWHNYGGADNDLDNPCHPQVPEGKTWKCSRCQNA